jgi:RsiW-degrading membrane proteinase PrsW (M82 family)
MVNYVLDFVGLILILKWFKFQITDYKSLTNKSDYFTIDRFKYIIVTIIVVSIPLLVVNFTSIEESNHLNKAVIEQNKYIFAIAISIFITLVWLIYIYRLDLFNKEKKRNLIFIVILSSFITLFAEIPYNFIHSLGFTNSHEIIPSMIYNVFGIGLVEELMKLIPLLIVLKFTKAIDEPYDYILYASASALGFSLVENAMYLERYGLQIINARAIYATVAHMTFSSMIAYGLFLTKYKKTRYPSFLVVLVFFFFAIFSHGFYDFWVLNKSVAAYKGLTTLFLLLTIHLWFVMKNNTINASNYYDKSKVINNDRLKIYLIISLLTIFMLSYVFVAFKWNSREANAFLIQSLLVYGYIIFYLVATLTKFDIVKGVVKPFKWSLKFLVPKSKKGKRTI